MAEDKMRDSMLDKDSAAYQKRREQVRRAQRSHRERKENHIKALEDQVHQLRSNEKKILRENEALAAQVAALRCRVVQSEASSNGAWQLAQQQQQPHHHLLLNDDTAVSGAFSWAGPDTMMPALEADACSYSACESLPSWPLPSLDGSDCSRSIAGSESFSVPDFPIIAPSSLGTNSCTAVSRRPSTRSLGDVNKTDLALEFILTLEKPCFNRASSAVFDMGHPTDFAVSVPKNAISYHSFLEDDVLSSCNDPQADTGKSLDKLLSLSSAFCLTSEVTPIQAWQHIIEHPRFASLGAETLRRLVEDMLEHIRCYGFGAVIETTVFKMLFSNVLTNG